MTFLTINRRLPDLEELSDLSIHPDLCAADPGEVRFSVTVEISVGALEFLKAEIDTLTARIEATKGRNRLLESRRSRLDAQRDFIQRLGWEIAASENRERGAAASK